jgi:hypothetical protein
MTDFLRFRHRLLPYLYTMNVRSATEGTPLVRPMYWGYAERKEAYRVPNEYLFGSQLLVIPITAPQDFSLRLAKTKGWLPPGKYVDIFSGAVYNGDRMLWISRRLEEYPVFAKEGSIIPLDAASEPGNGAGNPENIEVFVVLGADGEFEILEDDGKGSSPDEVEWIKTPIKYSHDSGTLTIGPSIGTISTTKEREWTIRFLGLREVYDIDVLVGTQQKKVEPLKEKNGVIVHVGKIAADTKVFVSLGKTPQLSHNDVGAFVRPILADAQIQFSLKEDIWQIVAAKVPSTVKISGLDALEMDENLRNAVLEYVLAE